MNTAEDIAKAREMLVRLSEMVGDDKDKLAFVEAYRKDVQAAESAMTMMSSESYLETIKSLEESESASLKAANTADLLKTPAETIKLVISEAQVIRRVINTLKGPDCKHVIERLEAAIATLDDEKEVNN